MTFHFFYDRFDSSLNDQRLSKKYARGYLFIELVDKAFEAWCQKRGVMKKWRNGQKPQPGEDPKYDSAMNFFQAQRKDNLRKRLVRERCIHYIFEKRKKA